MRRGHCLDWTEILRKGGIPEPPGREAALAPKMRRFEATLRRKKTGAVIEEEIEARAYYVALAHFRQNFKDYVITRLADATITDCGHGDDGA